METFSTIYSQNVLCYIFTFMFYPSLLTLSYLLFFLILFSFFFFFFHCLPYHLSSLSFSFFSFLLIPFLFFFSSLLFSSLFFISIIPYSFSLLFYFTYLSFFFFPHSLSFLHSYTDPSATLPSKPAPLPDAPKETKSKDKLIVRRLNEVTDIDLRKRKCRVIVRNLSFLGAISDFFYFLNFLMFSTALFIDVFVCLLILRQTENS